jgi:hypothetical protein
MRAACHDPQARSGPLATTRQHCLKGALMAQPDRLPFRSVMCGLDSRVDPFDRNAMPLRLSLSFPGAGAEIFWRCPCVLQIARQRSPDAPIVCRRVHEDGGGSMNLGRLTSDQSWAPMRGVRRPMRSWESMRPRERRRQEVPRSHGPAEEMLDGPEVNFRTGDRLRGARPRHDTRWPAATSFGRSTAGQIAGMATVLGSRR